MAPKRRQLLKGIGAGATISLAGLPTAAADGTERVFVHPRDGLLGEVLNAVDAVDGTTLFEYDNFEFVAAEIPSEKRDELLADVRVAFIEDDEAVGIPSDWTPSVPNLFDSGGDIDCSTHPSQQPSWGWERISADAVDHDGTGVDVGILDTGIESDHCSLAVAGGRNVTNSGLPNDYGDAHGHGTHVAGITGALDNDIGVIGVAPKTNLYAVKVLDDNGSGRYSNLVAGIDWCLSNDVELISMSLGGDSASSTMDQAIEDAHAAGHLLLSAAGNNGNDQDGVCDEETVTYPAAHDDVVAVSAMNEDETIASYSSVGAAVDVLAPGTEITSTYVNNEYTQASGTSAACPFVTGVAALLWQTHSADGPGPNDDVKETLTETAEPVLDTCEEGHGLVNARAAAGGDQDGATDIDDKDDDKDAPDREATADNETPSERDRDEEPDGRLQEERPSTSVRERLTSSRA
jgi:subtilisin family serine protease